MKKLIIIFIGITTLVSCTKKFEEINTNTKLATDSPGQYLYTGAQKNLVDIITSANVNENVLRLFSQYWAQTTYFDESRYDLITRDIAQNFWVALYRDVLKDLNTAKQNVQAADVTTDPLTPSASAKINQIATIEILECYTYYVALATWGNIPYTQALDIAILQPKYDDGLFIHQALISKLSANIDSLSNSDEASSFSGGDIIYNGDNAQWIKFAATLKMKLALLLSDVPGQGAAAQTAFESAAPMAMQSNSDDAIFHYLSTTPNNNPLADDLNPELTARKDFVAANTIIDYMNALNDPRLPGFFTSVTINDTTEIYKGGIYGTSNSYSGKSQVNPSLYDFDAPSTLVSYTDIEFMLAEAAERGWSVTGTAEQHYNAGITSSILMWGGTQTDADDYLANPDVAYSTAVGTWKQKIGMQNWLAMYNRGFEGWTSWRRYDAPLLNAPPAKSLSDIPTRYTYPINEQTLNGANYSAASSAIGGDTKTTKLYWDKY